jgi:NTE family protein
MISDSETASLSRPKIGLALGGGGAMGFTHIGVLKWLEENRIPVDVIAGTSMGGLVGGTYAMGMSPTEIEQFIKSLDWERIFDMNPPFNAFDFRRKEDRLDFPLGIGLRDQIFVPNGISAYRVDLVLSRLALPYYIISNFDELPIPYRCVATDLVNSTKVVLGEGSLSEALRATMSVPGAFTPVEVEGRVLVDGGLVDNVPVDVSRAMGAEVNIAVNCIPDNHGMDMRRIDSVLLGAINTVLMDNSSRYLEWADCIIHPEVGKLSYIDWKEVDEFIAAGYRAADQKGDELRKYQVDDEVWREYLRKRAEKKRNQLPAPAAIEIRGIVKNNQAAIKIKLQPFIGQPIDPVALEKALTEIMGAGFYESIRYKVILRNRIPILDINVKEKPYGPAFIGFTFSTSFVDERVRLNLGARRTSFDGIGLGSEFRSDLTLGKEPSLNLELYKPISTSGFFVAPWVSFDQTNECLFEQSASTSEFQVNHYMLGFDLGSNFDKFNELRVGYRIGYQNAATKEGPSLPDMNGMIRKLEFQWSHRSINYETFSDGALFGDIKTNWYVEAPGALAPFGTSEESFKYTLPVDDKNVLVMLFSAGAMLKGETPLLQQYTLGGPFRLGAYHQDELRGENYCLGTVGLMRDLGKPLGIDNIYGAIFLETGGVFASWADIDCTANLSAGILCPTVWGSFYLGASLGQEKPVRINFLYGRIF